MIFDPQVLQLLTEREVCCEEIAVEVHVVRIQPGAVSVVVEAIRVEAGCEVQDGVVTQGLDTCVAAAAQLINEAEHHLTVDGLIAVHVGYVLHVVGRGGRGEAVRGERLISLLSFAFHAPLPALSLPVPLPCLTSDHPCLTPSSQGPVCCSVHAQQQDQ